MRYYYTLCLKCILPLAIFVGGEIMTLVGAEIAVILVGAENVTP